MSEDKAPFAVGDTVAYDYFTIGRVTEFVGQIEKFNPNGRSAYVRVPDQGVNVVPVSKLRRHDHE